MPKGSPLKAIFPVVPGNDLYKDTATMGGLIDIEFSAAYLALTGGLNSVGPILEGLQDPTKLAELLPAEIAHLGDLATFDAAFTAKTLSGGASAYDDKYWHARNPVNVLKKIAANGIPAYLVGGEYDLFQRGEPLDFSGLQNAWAGRPVTARCCRTRRRPGATSSSTGRSPTHRLDRGLNPLMLEWFDTWLKGAHTGMGKTPTPLHYYDLGTGKYTEHAQYPFGNATGTRYYFGAGNTMSTTKPAATSDTTLYWSPVGSPCGRPTDQWADGQRVADHRLRRSPVRRASTATTAVGQLGPDRTTFTTAPLTSAKTIAGPIDVTVNATATTTDTQWVAEVEDVAPDGTSTPLTEGALLGSLRKVSSSGTWRAKDGEILQPFHTYSKHDATPVTPGKLTRYDIDVFPTYATIAKGHSIRVTLSTADTPHLLPTLPALANLAGGVYQVQLGSSAVEIPLIPSS